MNPVRPPAVAGLFYPADPTELRTAVRGYLAAVRPPPTDPEASSPAEPLPPKAIVVPHAGYVYSAPVAASAYARIGAGRDRIRTVVLLGPAHYVPLRGIGAPGFEAFATPLGRLAVDRTSVNRTLGVRWVRIDDEAHLPEHSLEVQLPFLQELLGPVAIVPLLVGTASAAEVAAVLESVWGGPETLVVISSDLSHYLTYEEARARDQATADAVMELAPERVGPHDACGHIVLQGLLHLAGRHQLRAELLDLRNSGDTGGSRRRVVGYGAFVFSRTRRGG